MKNPKKVKLIAAIALVTLLIASFMLMAMPVQAYWTNVQGTRVELDELTNVQENGGRLLPSGVTPDVVFKADLYLSFRPNPVGVNQPVLVNLWSVPGPAYTRYFTDYTVTITKPDGTEIERKLDSYWADSTAWFEFAPDQEGEWTLQLYRPGQYFPPGNYTTPAGVGNEGYFESFTRSLYYEPASTPELSLTVQADMVLSWPPSDLPTDYWTRPVAKENREWWTILGNYPWYGPSGGPIWDELYPNTSPYYFPRARFTPWVQGPESAHLVWKQYNGLDAGLVGGDYGQYYETGSGGTPNIIYNGKCYDTITKPFNGETQSVWICYDLRTGEVYWETTDVSAPSYIEYSQGLPAVPGATAATSFTAALIGISGNKLRKFDPETGRMTLERDIPSMSNTYYRNGYVLSVQTINAAAQDWRLINWTTAGNTANFNDRIISNITFTRNNLGMFQDFGTGICWVVREPNAWNPDGLNQWNLGHPFVDTTWDSATGFRFGTRICAWSLKTGQLLYNFTLVESPYSQGSEIADHGKFVVLMQDQEDLNGGGYFMCFDQDNGNLLWKSEQMDYPWDLPGFGAYSIASAYGLFYRFGYSGVYAFNWTNGNIEWKYEAPAFSPYESPYIDEDGNTVYSFNAGGWVADGKLYAYNTEHSTTQPITRGWGIHCMNATTGEFIWKTKIWGSIGPIADGYLTVSGYDGYAYVFGKGKSATTVTAAPKTIAKGEAVLIEGTVLDMSPAQPETPCVSKNSMATQMEYLHMGQPIDGLWGNETIDGVDVTLTAMDTDDPINVVDLGTVTSNGYTGKFGMEWTPTDEGFYEIYASFGPTEAYGSSSASTFISVGPAPQETQTPEPSPEQPEHPIISTEAVLIIGVVVVAVVAILAYWAYKRRQ